MIKLNFFKTEFIEKNLKLNLFKYRNDKTEFIEVQITMPKVQTMVWFILPTSHLHLIILSYFLF
jgi:hypothetical protein